MAYYVRLDSEGHKQLHWDRCKLRHREDGSRWYGPFTTFEEAREHGGREAGDGCACLQQRLDY